MSLDKKQFESLIRQTLTDFDPAFCSDAAVNLLLGTAAVESAFGTYIRQIKGPALGVFQMEPDTFTWLRVNYEGRLTELMTAQFNHLEWNLRLAIIMARLRYRIVPEPLPEAGDVTGLAAYWKKHYNSIKGKGTVGDFTHNYLRFIA
jgi:hypothetical protein